MKTIIERCLPTSDKYEIEKNEEKCYYTFPIKHIFTTLKDKDV